MALWSWETLPDGRVAIDRGDGEGLVVRELAPVFDVPAKTAKTLEWEALARDKAAKYGIPVSWLLAFILAESGGHPSAENFCCTGLVGVMTKPPVHGKSTAQMLDPEQNLDYAGELIRRSIDHGNTELPEVASIHVGGATSDYRPHPSSKSPWGMVEHMWAKQADGTVGYLERIARAHNMFVSILDGPVKEPPSTQPPLTKASSSVFPFVVGLVVGVTGIWLTDRAVRSGGRRR